jgi:hypothetical protein
MTAVIVDFVPLQPHREMKKISRLRSENYHVSAFLCISCCSAETVKEAYLEGPAPFKVRTDVGD